MNGPRLINGLRIAWTVFWGIVCVLLIVSWVRSYYSVNRIRFVSDLGLSNAEIISWRGAFHIIRGQPSHVVIRNPYLLSVLAVLTIAGLAWVRFSRNFALRSFLIATALIAAVLGLIVYSTKVVKMRALDVPRWAPSDLKVDDPGSTSDQRREEWPEQKPLHDR